MATKKADLVERARRLGHAIDDPDSITAAELKDLIDRSEADREADDGPGDGAAPADNNEGRGGETDDAPTRVRLLRNCGDRQIYEVIERTDKELEQMGLNKGDYEKLDDSDRQRDQRANHDSSQGNEAAPRDQRTDRQMTGNDTKKG